MTAVTTPAATGLTGRGVLWTDRPVWLTWALLVAASVVTTWILTSESIEPRWGLILTFAVAAWKVRLVLTDFVELRHAPLVGRVIFEGWAIALPLTLIVLTWPR